MQKRFVIEIVLDTETAKVIDGSINTGMYNRTEFADEFEPASIKDTALYIKEELENYLD